MQLSFAISLFFVAGIAELMRHSGVDISPLTALIAVSVAMAGAGLVLLGRDAQQLIRPRKTRQYGIVLLGWSWHRTGRLLLSVPFLCAVPIFLASLVTDFVLVPQSAGALFSALFVQVAIVALAQELFFREAVLKTFGAVLPVAFFVSAGASLLFHLPNGLPAALIAAGAALAYMALRVAGMNLFAVAAVHGGVSVLLGRVLVAQIAPQDIWTYALSVSAGHALFAVALLALIRAAPRLQIRAPG